MILTLRQLPPRAHRIPSHLRKDITSDFFHFLFCVITLPTLLFLPSEHTHVMLAFLKYFSLNPTLPSSNTPILHIFLESFNSSISSLPILILPTETSLIKAIGVLHTVESKGNSHSTSSLTTQKPLTYQPHHYLEPFVHLVENINPTCVSYFTVSSLQSSFPDF